METIQWKDCEMCGKKKVKEPYKYCFECNKARKEQKEQQPKPELKSASQYVPEDDSRICSMALAYAKDLAVAGKIDVKDVFTWASTFKQFIKLGNAEHPFFEENLK